LGIEEGGALSPQHFGAREGDFKKAKNKGREVDPASPLF
jgi:hypothetical protein